VSRFLILLLRYRGDDVRICRLTVTKLFGIFDHAVNFNHGERITILHGPNGYGKTALLRILNALCNLRLSELRSIPFQECQIDFDDGRAIRVIRTVTQIQRPGRRGGNAVSLEFQLCDEAGTQDKFVPIPSDRTGTFPASIVDDIVPELVRVGANRWHNSITGEVMTLDEVREAYADALPLELQDRRGYPEWLQVVKENLPTRLIETQRLLSQARLRSDRPYRDSVEWQPAVAKYSAELASSIQAQLAESAALSSSLDRSFPFRLVQQGLDSEVSDDQLRDKQIQVEAKRSRLIAVGLLDQDGENFDEFRLSQAVDDRTKSVLAFYFGDVSRKLDVYSDMADKIELLTAIVNQRFQYKSMTVNKDKGFVFTTSKGDELSPKDLSSGEQHELVLFYELLFSIKPGSLILIDEPEISLHIAWQMEFLRDLRKTTALSDFDALIATHSPQIINDRWDLTVELRGPLE
jgi:predicted ATP-binding protein involved in virulence